MRQFDKSFSEEFINGIAKLSEMIGGALLITDNKRLILLANKGALELFGKNIVGRAGRPYVCAGPKGISFAVDSD